ncbi:MAG: type II toxin-antitoxin system RelE/ParE family toxin [Spirochaetia bacterium]
MSLKYEVIIYWSRDDESFIAEVPELPGCAPDGPTYQPALEAVEVVAGERRRCTCIAKFLRDRIAGEEDPRRIGEALEGSRFGEFWRHRTGDWRMICWIEDAEVVVLVLKVGHRRLVYREK